MTQNESRQRVYMELAVLAVLLLLPLGTASLYSAYYINSLATRIAIFAIILLGYDLAAGYTGLVSLGHAMFYGIGAYTAALVLSSISDSLVVAMVVGIAVSTVIAVLIGFLSTRLRGIYFAFLTLAFGQFFYLAAFNWVSLTGGENGLHSIPKVPLAIPGVLELDLSQSFNYYYFVIFLLALSYLFCRRIVASPFGKVLEAIKQNEGRAELLGYDVRRYKRRVFAISGMLGGLAGTLFAELQRFVAPDVLHWHLSGDLILMTWLGGVGTLIGPVIGGAVILLFRDLLGSVFQQYWELFTGALYMLFVLFSPRGIVGFVQTRWTKRRRTP